MNWLHNAYSTIAQLALPLPNVAADTDRFTEIVNIVLGITGAIALLIIVLAGFRLIFSQGSPNEVAVARNAIIYSFVGLVVIMFAFAIVNFVVKGIT